MLSVTRLVNSWFAARSTPRAAAPVIVGRAARAAVESLEGRRMHAVTAAVAGGVLTVTGDNGVNAIVVARDAGGNLSVNGGAVGIVGGPANTTTVRGIVVNGLGGNDAISLDETHEVLPAATLSGGAGNDTLTGGSGADLLNGDAGDDVLLGKAGNDTLHGGAGNDALTGGVGTDQAFGDAGDDRMIWNPGEGSDVNEGGDGSDTVVVIGGNGAETFTAVANGTRVRFDRVSPGPFFVDIGTSEKLTLDAAGGNDTFTAGNGLATLIAPDVHGGAGNDTLTGGDGNDTLSGDDGDDLIVGGRGADTALLGAGNDTFVWNPGDGSDVVDGQAGNDTMLFNGANVAENVDLSATRDGHLLFTRDVAGITMDAVGVEGVTFNALGGVDRVTVHDLARTDVTGVTLNLQGSVGGPADGATDAVIVEGSKSADHVTVAGSAAGGVTVGGLAATVTIAGADANDTLAVNALKGNDVVDASGLGAGTMKFSADGGQGNDVLIGSPGDDTLLGEQGNDVLIGGAGTDLLNGGLGHDVVVQ